VLKDRNQSSSPLHEARSYFLRVGLLWFAVDESDFEAERASDACQRVEICGPVTSFEAGDNRVRGAQTLGELLLRQLVLDPVGDEAFGNFVCYTKFFDRRPICGVGLDFESAVPGNIVAQR
jgi:hypothetical protein